MTETTNTTAAALPDEIVARATKALIQSYCRASGAPLSTVGDELYQLRRAEANAALTAAGVPGLLAENAAARELLSAICVRQGQGDFEQGFGADSRFEWVARIQKFLDSPSAGGNLLAEVERLREFRKQIEADHRAVMAERDTLRAHVARC